MEAEQRAVTEEEEKQVGNIQKEIDQIDKTIKILEDIKNRMNNQEIEPDDSEGEQRAEEEEKDFEEYLRGMTNGELRSDVNMTTTDNGAVIPTTIAQKIIDKVYDISPILEKATKYNVKGKLTIPYYPADSNDIGMAYAEEFVELESTAGKFDSITLSGFLAGALTLVSRSLMNNSQFDIVSYVINHMAYNIARWQENELLNGTDNKIEGLSKVTNSVETASSTAIKSDELIDLQDSIKDAFQENAIWIMSNKTRTSLRKLKDGNNRYLLQDDITAPFGKVLLGKPVYVSDNMNEIEAGKPAIYYGDMSGLAVKVAEELEIQVLREKYATQHVVGVVAWLEMDAKVENAQKIAKLVMKAGS